MTNQEHRAGGPRLPQPGLVPWRVETLHVHGRDGRWLGAFPKQRNWHENQRLAARVQNRTLVEPGLQAARDAQAERRFPSEAKLYDLNARGRGGVRHGRAAA